MIDHQAYVVAAQQRAAQAGRHPLEAQTLAAAVHQIASRVSALDYFVKPPGRQSGSVYGLGGARFLEGVEWWRRDGQTLVLATPPSKWVMPAAFGSVGLLMVLIVAWSLREAPWWLILGVEALIVASVFGIMLMGWIFSRMQGKRRLIIDSQQRFVVELAGKRVRLSVPFDLLTCVTLRSFEDSDSGTITEVILSTGFAELWVHQTDSREGMQLAQDLAQELHVPFVAPAA